MQEIARGSFVCEFASYFIQRLISYLIRQTLTLSTYVLVMISQICRGVRVGSSGGASPWRLLPIRSRQFCARCTLDTFIPTHLLFTNWKLRLKFFGSYVGAGHVLSGRVALRQCGALHKPLVRAESRAGPRVRRASGPALPAHCALRLPRHRHTRRARVWRFWIYSIFTYFYGGLHKYFFAGSTTEKSIGWWRVSAYSFASAVLLAVAIVLPLHLHLHVIPIPIEFFIIIFKLLVNICLRLCLSVCIFICTYVFILKCMQVCMLMAVFDLFLSLAILLRYR